LDWNHLKHELGPPQIGIESREHGLPSEEVDKDQSQVVPNVKSRSLSHIGLVEVSKGDLEGILEVDNTGLAVFLLELIDLIGDG